MFYIIPLATLIFLFIIYRRQIAENANITKMKNKKANKVALKRMKEAGKLLADGNCDQFYDEVLKALWGYTGDKLNISSSMLSKDNIEGKLLEHQVPQDVINRKIPARRLKAKKKTRRFSQSGGLKGGRIRGRTNP